MQKVKSSKTKRNRLGFFDEDRNIATAEEEKLAVKLPKAYKQPKIE